MGDILVILQSALIETFPVTIKKREVASFQVCTIFKCENKLQKQSLKSNL